MVSAGAIRFAAGIIGNITALVLFLSPVPTFIGICKKKTVEQYSPIPYLATFVNCMLWVVYGMPFIHPHSILVVTINGAGFFIELLYLILFVIYSDKKKRIKIVLIAIGEIIVVGIMTALVLTFAHTTKRRSSIVGVIGVICNILMYASPLSVMKLVITTKSVEYMPFTLSLAAFANGIAWTIYALFPLDPYIAAPNGLGSLFALVQLILYATYYKSTKEQLAARKAKSAMGLSEVYNGNSEKLGQNGRAQIP
ncbi:bidirectional sugar transporter SWEET4-like [Amaranthus tricolor]|uniref:bidirectional sugar transporter SWEET4-like n=1 Tax=Amaranthus tricolor TaxID=29722 RepID=UPI002582B3EB|nr:bidirectional sugar transporter SWEET4-like [Amaranthus tricolor]